MHPGLFVIVYGQALFTSTQLDSSSVELFTDTSLNTKSALFTASHVGPLDGSLNWCGTNSDIFIPVTIALNPDPPQRGHPLQVTLVGPLKEDIVQGAIAHVKIKLGFIGLIDRDYDVCSEIHQIDKQCPIPNGEFRLEKTFDIPNEVPPGHYRIHIDARNADGKPITCADADFRM